MVIYLQAVDLLSSDLLWIWVRMVLVCLLIKLQPLFFILGEILQQKGTYRIY